MKKRMRFFLLGLGCLFSATLLSNPSYQFTSNQTSDFVLAPETPTEFVNVFVWTINAVCTMVTELDTVPLSFKVIKRTGSLDGNPLSAGDQMDVNVHPMDVVRISASPGARVELTNHSTKDIIARCYTT